VIVIVGAAHLRGVIFCCSQLESGTSCRHAVFLHLLPWKRSYQEVGAPQPPPSPINEKRVAEQYVTLRAFCGHDGSVNAAVWSAGDTNRAFNAKYSLLVSRRGRACSGSCRTKSYRHPLLIPSPPFRPLSFVAGILASHALATAFFTIALLRFRKPSFKRRDGFL
jgi:hypothetical protein